MLERVRLITAPVILLILLPACASSTGQPASATPLLPTTTQIPSTVTPIMPTTTPTPLLHTAEPTAIPICRDQDIGDLAELGLPIEGVWNPEKFGEPSVNLNPVDFNIHTREMHNRTITVAIEKNFQLMDWNGNKLRQEEVAEFVFDTWAIFWQEFGGFAWPSYTVVFGPEIPYGTEGWSILGFDYGSTVFRNIREIPSIHAGEVLLEEFLKPIGISQYCLSKDTNVDPRRINKIVHAQRSITADTALRLSRFFGTSERFWLNLQALYDLELQKMELGDRLEEEV
jgi:addiction module HigA family antidote